ncbi:MAG: TlpA disulfide reductase family protein [Bacteroidota bacterium]|nr:TlpA disulfide reductase family protein [Bacteroidota bacterium]
MKRKYFIIGFIVGVLLIIALTITVFVLFIQQSKDSADDFIKNETIVEDEIIVFPVTQMELDSLFFENIYDRGTYFPAKDSIHYTFINYWATWCIPCVSELPEFAELIESHKDLSNSIVFIFATQEDEEKVNSFAEKKKVNLPYFTFSKNNQPKFINHSTIPTSYLIDEKNLLIYKFKGLKKWNTDFYYKILRTFVLAGTVSYRKV